MMQIDKAMAKQAHEVEKRLIQFAEHVSTHPLDAALLKEAALLISQQQAILVNLRGHIVSGLNACYNAEVALCDARDLFTGADEDEDEGKE